MPLMKIVLQNDEESALRKLAKREMRDPRAQAALLIRYELQNLGLLLVDRDTGAVTQLNSQGKASDS